MLNLKKLNKRILDDLKKRGLSLNEIESMTPQQAFDAVCKWNGLIGWGDTLFAIVETLQKAEKSRMPWKNKLDKDQLEHLKTHDVTTFKQIKMRADWRITYLEHNQTVNEVCWKCRRIYLDLDLPI